MSNVKTEYSQRRQHKKRKLRKICLLTLPFVLLAVIISGAGVSIVEYQTYNAKYHSDIALAQTGVQHLRTAIALLGALPKNPLDGHTVSLAQHEFSAASTIFLQLDNDLKSVPGIGVYIPAYGTRLSSALRLVPLAIEVSQAGITSCNIMSLLISKVSNPFNTQGHGLTMADLAVIAQDVHQIKATLSLSIDQVNHLQPSDLQLDPRIGKIIDTFKNNVPALQSWLDAAEKFLSVAPTVLGITTPAKYLVEILDSTELRPSGGFIGNYGTATLSGGRLLATHITDVYLLDRPFEAAGNVIPYPPAYTWFNLWPHWSFRDSGLDADFPTAARYGEQNYMREGGNVPVQGVIAITPTLIQRAMQITGPIEVPEYHETVTPQNLIARIHYYQLNPNSGSGSDLIPSPGGHSSLRKRFTELLAEHLLARVRQLSSPYLAQFVQLVVNSVHSKDVQLYFNSSIAENLLQRFHLDSAIQSSDGDGLFVVDTNIAGNKANSFIMNTLNDQVSIDAEGNAIHQTTISYAWTNSGQFYGSPIYRDYVRVYTPPGSMLQMQNGWQPRGTSETFGHQVWAGYFELSYGQIRHITLTWMAPRAAKKDSSGWHYHYLIQRQAGISWQLNLRMRLPSCGAMTNISAGLRATNKQEIAITGTLTEDLNAEIDYTCR